MLPNFIVIGGNRCGTTWLAKNLRLHPDIYMPQKKELHFFDNDFDKGWDYYEAYFPNKECGTCKAIGEATPAYLYKPQVASLIKSRMPGIKLIASLRNPIDRAYSQYWNLVAAAPSDKHINRRLSFEEKLAFTPSLINQGLYDEELSIYYELFPKENVLVVIYEEMVRDPQSHLKKIYEFLGVNVDFASPLQDVRINSAASKLGRSRILDLAYKGFYRLIRIPSLSRRIDKFNAKQLPDIHPDTRERLREKFAPNIANLERMLDRDLGVWRNYEDAGSEER